jgi:amidase
VNDTELAFAGIGRQAQLMASGAVSSREPVEICVKRIERLDRTINAFRIVLAEKAQMEADQADARRRAARPWAQATPPGFA